MPQDHSPSIPIHHPLSRSEPGLYYVAQAKVVSDLRRIGGHGLKEAGKAPISRESTTKSFRYHGATVLLDIDPIPLSNDREAETPRFAESFVWFCLVH
jgi:hypothetical protein